MTRSRTLTSALAFLLTAACAVWAATQPTVVRQALSLPHIPRLGTEPVLDGKLTEWNSAAVVPVRAASAIIHLADTREYRGPAFDGAELRLAWLDRGLAVAVTVLDSSIVVDTGDACYTRDCIELFVDMRTDLLASAPYSAGAMQLFVLPPAAGSAPRVKINPRDGALPAVKIGGTADAGRYTVELVIPWHAGLKPAKGAQVGLMCSFNDYDPSDSAAFQPLCMAVRGTRDLWNAPERFVRWQLSDGSKYGPAANLGPMVELDIPAVVLRPGKRSFVADFGGTLAMRARSLDIMFVDSAGLVIAQSASAVTGPFWAAWPRSSAAVVTIDPGTLPDGHYSVVATVRDSARAVLGSSVVSTSVHSTVMATAEKSLPNVKLGAVVAKDPGLALQWVGAAAALERLKHWLVVGNRDAITQVAAEVKARIAIAEGKPAETPFMLDLLTLTESDPLEAKVEFSPEYGWADVLYFWGGMPLACVAVKNHATDSAASTALASIHSQGGAVRFADTTFASLRAMVSRTTARVTPFDMKSFDPARHVATVGVGYDMVSVKDSANLDLLPPGDLVIFPGCGEALKARLTALPASRGVRMVSSTDSVRGDVYSIAGAIPDSLLKALSAQPNVEIAACIPGPYSLRVVRGSRAYICAGASPSAVRRAMGLTLAGKAVGAADIDSLRRELVREAMPKGIKPLARTLMAGDVHAHTAHSDGMPTPEGLLLEAMYANVAFTVVSDHNTLDGARGGAEALSANGFVYPLIIGEEVTTDSLHMNAYPLAGYVSPNQSRDSIISKVHRQGGVIQVNHPAFDGTRLFRAQQKRRNAFDAYEHIPYAYDSWRDKPDSLPVVTGSTDTHDGLFWDLERTVVPGATINDAALVGAIRDAKAVVVSSYSRDYLYGPQKQTSAVWASLAEGKTVRAQQAASVKKWLANANLWGLTEQSKPRRQAM